MVNKQSKINKKLKDIHKDIKEINNKKESLHKKIEKTKDKKDKTSPEFWLSRIRETLREKDSGWAEIDSKIKNNKANSKVNDELIKELASITLKDKEQNYIEMLEERLSTLEKIKNEKPKGKLATVSVLSNDFEEQFESILMETVKKPEMNEETNRIIEILTREGNNFLCHSVELLDKGYEYCPTCFQDLNDSNVVKEQILEVLQNQNESELERKLLDFKIPEIKNISTEYKQFDNFDRCEELINNYNSIKQNYENELNKKADNLYRTMKITNNIKLSDLQKDINNTIKNLNQEIENYNKKFDDKKRIMNEARELNNKIAHNKIIPDYEEYMKAKTYLEQLLEEVDTLNQDYKKAQKSESRAMDDFNNIEFGLNDINKNLSIIYLNDKNIDVIEENGVYKVQIDGNNVALNKLSTGQKNAITLAYFFSTIHNGHSLESKYKNEMIVVLDDPVSSFDYNNKIGIFSFLRYQFKNIIKGCNQSKIIVLTHDSGVSYNLCKIFDDIKEQRGLSKQSSNIKIRNKLYQLTNTYNDFFRHTKPEESLYTTMFQDIYLFASGNLNSDNYTNSIGNNMRRVLESFTTFCYKEGITSISNDSEILHLIEDETDREFYEHFMYRFLLHGESHTEEIAIHTSESSINKLDIGLHDKKEAAQKFIYFIYILNRLHVIKHLNTKNSKCKEAFDEALIKTWAPNNGGAS